LGSADRKTFAAFVTGSIDSSRPQLYRGRDGNLRDRRRAVFRMVISPERASGLDLRHLTLASVTALERDLGSEGLRWIAAVHRNTAHHHVHLVLAGMREDGRGGIVRVDITKSRLAAMKEALSLEIERQRSGREPLPRFHDRPSPGVGGEADSPAIAPPVARPVIVQAPQARPPARNRVAFGDSQVTGYQRTRHASSLVALRAVARRYSRQMQREIEREARLRGWERAA
jgi:hypothetical protein